VLPSAAATLPPPSHYCRPPASRTAPSLPLPTASPTPLAIVCPLPCSLAVSVFIISIAWPICAVSHEQSLPVQSSLASTDMTGLLCSLAVSVFLISIAWPMLHVGGASPGVPAPHPHHPTLQF
jgi:hypothetical protein